MPQPKQYENRAQRQAAYRRRRAQAHAAQLAARSLPTLPALPTMPGHRRWTALEQLAIWALQTDLEERHNYFDDRSEAWQESERAEAFQERIDILEQALEPLLDL